MRYKSGRIRCNNWIYIYPHLSNWLHNLITDFKKLISLVLRKCNQYGIAPGIHIVNPSQKELNLKINYGYRFLAYSIDAVMLLKATQIENLKI